MPSGITAAIYEGKDTSLRDYLIRVGRSMSMAIMQRDDDPGAPVKRREISAYCQTDVDKALAKIDRLLTMTIEEAQIASELSDIERALAIEAAIIKDTVLRERYDAMMREVRAWKPKPKVAYVKEHAIKYLQESIDHDCDDDPAQYYPKPAGLSGAEWLRKARVDAEEELVRAETQLAEEVARVADYNEHIDAFLESLPASQEEDLNVDTEDQAR